jgi:hypothetical protein
MLFGSPSFECPCRLSAVCVDVLGWSWRSRLVAPERRSVGGAPRVLQPVDEDVQAGGEPLVTVVEPDVLAEGDQGGEAVGRQRAEELVEPVPGGRVADALLVDGGGGC